jgi:GDP-D-mannose dehydratase
MHPLSRIIIKVSDKYGSWGKTLRSSFNTWRIDHLYQDQHPINFKLHYGTLTDSTNIIRNYTTGTTG